MQQYEEPDFERIRRIRMVREKFLKDANCSEEQFSRLLGIKPSELKKIESGQKDIFLDVFKKCSDILDISVDHLVSNKIMHNDQFNEPILFTVQIGSVIHAIRTQLAERDNRSHWRDYSLKSVAKKLGISSMELKRIEGLNKSNHFENSRFVNKLAGIFNLSINYIEDLIESSFPRGDERKEAKSKDISQVRYIKQDGDIKGIIVLKGKLSTDDIVSLNEQIKSGVDLLLSKSSRKQ